MRIDILEKSGLNIDGKEILLGSPIQEAIAKLGVSDVFEDHYYFFDGTLLFTVDHAKSIREIEVRNPEDDRVVVMFRSVNLFQEEKDFIMPHLIEMNGEPLSDDGGIYSSEKLGISFSFGMSEEAIEDIIRESKRDGVYDEMKEEIEHDIYRSKHIEAFLITRP
jgi:hypothetical protein